MNVSLPDLHLVITAPKVELREDASSLQLIKYVVDAGERTHVLHSDLVQLTVINAQTSRPVLLLRQ